MAARVGALGNRNNREEICIAWRLAARVCPARRWLKYSGSGRALAPGGGKVPPGSLGLCRLAALGAAPGDFAAGYDLCALILIDNDATLGSGDAVP